MKKELVTIALNDFELDKILPSGTPKAGVRRAKVATEVCTKIIRDFMDGGGKKEEVAEVKPASEETAKMKKETSKASGKPQVAKKSTKAKK